MASITIIHAKGVADDFRSLLGVDVRLDVWTLTWFLIQAALVGVVPLAAAVVVFRSRRTGIGSRSRFVIATALPVEGVALIASVGALLDESALPDELAFDLFASCFLLW